MGGRACRGGGARCPAGTAQQTQQDGWDLLGLLSGTRPTGLGGWGRSLRPVLGLSGDKAKIGNARGSGSRAGPGAGLGTRAMPKGGHQQVACWDWTAQQTQQDGQRLDTSKQAGNIR